MAWWLFPYFILWVVFVILMGGGLGLIGFWVEWVFIWVFPGCGHSGYRYAGACLGT